MIDAAIGVIQFIVFAFGVLVVVSSMEEQIQEDLDILEEIRSMVATCIGVGMMILGLV